MALTIGFLAFPGLTQLDMTGPLQVLGRLPDSTCHVVAKSMDPVKSDGVLSILPTIAFADCPKLDLICVPGGHGVADVVRDEETLQFVRRQGAQAQWVTSVCTGAFILGAAGLIRGKHVATHWAYRELLPLVGASASAARVARDGNVMTGGGVTAGIDFALTLMAEISSPGVAQAVQLALEYDPAPPFDSGNPKFAPPQVKQRVDAFYEGARARMRAALVD
jgi:cyclohexyl-isocyanide hydratase